MDAWPYTYVFQSCICNFKWCIYIRWCSCVMKLFYSPQDGRSPLHLAAEKGHIDTLAILLKHGADVDTKDKVSDL